jgi:hypothetical protein
MREGAHAARMLEPPRGNRVDLMDGFERYCAIAAIAGFLLLAVLIPILELR